VAGRPWVLREVALGASRTIEYDVAVLPWGATEAHNFHLPFGTDTIQAEAVAAEAAARAWRRGVRAIVLPAIPMGANAQQLDTPLTLNLSPSTQALVLEDVVASLERHCIRKMLILNGHGGNDFKAMVRELQARTDVFLCVSNWWTVADADTVFDEPGDHAGELETSVMQHVAPELVAPLEEAGPGNARVFRIAGLRTGLAWAPRDWARVTDDTGVGSPTAATPAKGARFLDATAEALATFMVDLAAADLEDLYGEPPSET
jgi:creatinine amidohydrolase